MSKVNAYAAPSATQALEPFQIVRREPGTKDVVIDIRYCGVCHSDVHQARDEWGGSIFPMVPGHEIVGTVARVGSQVSRYKVGDRVGVGCFVDSCRECPSCKEGLEQYCDRGMNGTYNSTEKDGKTPTYGGYSTQIVVDENYVLSIPNQLPFDRAAPLLCAGITTYSPLRHWKAGPGKKVAVVGLGGLGHMAVKLAHAMGAEVTVLSQTLKKKEDGMKFGAKHFYATSEPGMFEKLAGTYDLILNTVSVELDMSQYLSLLKRDGVMVLLGVPTKAPEVHAFSLIGKRTSLAGSLIGGIAETQEMLNFCAKHNISSDIEVVPVQKINESYERMIKGDVRYRFVIDIDSMKK
jgi:uncharacterized zinc-type alcohol dehydrogenase-like protein